MEFQQGDRVLGRYQVEGCMGGGVVSRVYRATRLSNGQPVVVKVLHGIPTGSRVAARFVREARLLAQVRHPAVVELLDFGQLPDDSLCIITELVDGHALDELLLDLGPIPWPEVLRLALSILSGLEALHRAGVLHRNLTPANIMVLPDPPVRVKILDLGFAKGSGDESEEALTGAGETVGSPAYMAPEQVFGGALTGRADIYSTALILWELLTGKQPFPSATMAHLTARAKALLPPPAPPSSCPPVPPALAAVLRKAASPQADDRFPSARAFADALREARRVAQRAAPRGASRGSRAPLAAASQPSLRPASRPSSPHVSPAATSPAATSPAATSPAATSPAAISPAAISPPGPPPPVPPAAGRRARHASFAPDAPTEPDLPAIQRDAQGRGVLPPAAARPEPSPPRPRSDWRQHAAAPPAAPEPAAPRSPPVGQPEEGRRPAGAQRTALFGTPHAPASPGQAPQAPPAAETMAYFGEPSAVVAVPAGAPTKAPAPGPPATPSPRPSQTRQDAAARAAVLPTQPAQPARGHVPGVPPEPAPSPHPAPPPTAAPSLAAGDEPHAVEPSVHVALAVRAARLAKRSFQRRLRQALGAWGDAHRFNEDTWFLFLHATSEAAARNRVGVLVRRFQQQLGDDTRGAWAAVEPEDCVVPDEGYGEADELADGLKKLLAQVGM